MHLTLVLQTNVRGLPEYLHAASGSAGGRSKGRSAGTGVACLRERVICELPERAHADSARRVQVFGKSAHVGLQHQGENAFERMHHVVGRLQRLKHEVEQHSTRSRIGAEQARNSILMLGGQSGGGSNFNVVPENCWFTIDRRINPEEDLATEKAKFLTFWKAASAREFLWSGRFYRRAFSRMRRGVPLGKALYRSIRTVTGEAPRLSCARGCWKFVSTPRRESQPTPTVRPALCCACPNEYVDLRKVIETAGVYALTAIETLHP